MLLIAGKTRTNYFPTNDNRKPRAPNLNGLKLDDGPWRAYRMHTSPAIASPARRPPNGGRFFLRQSRLHGDGDANFYHRWKDDFQIQADAPAVHDFVEQMLEIRASLDAGRDVT